MKKFIYAILCFISIFILVGTVYISIDRYSVDRDRKISRNIAMFIVKKETGAEDINLEYPEYTIIITKDREGNIYNSRGQGVDINLNELNGDGYAENGYETYVYIKKMDVSNMLDFISKDYIMIGAILSSSLLVIVLFYALLREIKEVPASKEVKVEKKVQKPDEEFLKKLKALKLAMATYKIVPEESVEQMKKIVDSILKEYKYK